MPIDLTPMISLHRTRHSDSQTAGKQDNKGWCQSCDNTDQGLFTPLETRPESYRHSLWCNKSSTRACDESAPFWLDSPSFLLVLAAPWDHQHQRCSSSNELTCKHKATTHQCPSGLSMFNEKSVTRVNQISCTRRKSDRVFLIKLNTRHVLVLELLLEVLHQEQKGARKKT